MSEAFNDTVYLFSCGARGNKPFLTHDIDIFKIYNLAMSQGIWQTTFLALKKLYDQGDLILNKKVFDNWYQEVMIRAIQITQRNTAVSKTINALEQKNIQCCVLKGEVLAELYSNPICRISSDTDILIDKNLEKKAVNILKQCGFSIEPRYPNSHHTRCCHPLAGMIELHLRLCGELSEDVWFNKKILNIEKYRRIKISQANYITTLGITDGLIFITLHFIKHFLARGAGIRQLMDILLYMHYYDKEINWDRYKRLLKYLKYDKFINNAIGIGKKYLGFDENELPQSRYNNDVMQKILFDMEKGGIYGKNEVGREGSYKAYTEERFKKFKRGRYSYYMNKLGIRNITIPLLFPNRARMLIKYPYVKKNKLLLSVAWLHRFLNFILSVFKKKIKYHIKCQNSALSCDVVNERMDLIRKLDMI